MNHFKAVDKLQRRMETEAFRFEAPLSVSGKTTHQTHTHTHTHTHIHTQKHTHTQTRTNTHTQTTLI